MASYKALIVLALFAVAYAADEPAREKKGIATALTGLGYAGLPYGGYGGWAGYHPTVAGIHAAAVPTAYSAFPGYSGYPSYAGYPGYSGYPGYAGFPGYAKSGIFDGYHGGYASPYSYLHH